MTQKDIPNCFLPVTQLTVKLEKGGLSSLELIEEYLERIRKHDRNLGAFIYVYGEEVGATIVIRIFAGILFCTLLNLVFTNFELFTQIAFLNLPEMSAAPTFKQWVIDQVKGLVFIQIVIILLITFLEILKRIGIEKVIHICLSPFLKILNIGQSASTIVVVGLTLGLGFGGGLMIKDVKQGLVKPRSAVGALIFINLFHSIFEDTTILMLLGPSLMVILLVRGVFVFLLTYFLIKVFDFLPIKTYEKLLYSKPILRTAQSSNFS